MPVPPQLLERARSLRSTGTEAERFLWQLVRNRALGGMKFRRQVPMGPYVVDFLCEAARLIVEVDGGHHAEEEEARRDARRTQGLADEGWRVIRFWNHEVLQSPEVVLEAVWSGLFALRAREG